MSRWGDRSDVPRGEVYDRRWRELEASGKSVHGEADLIEALGPATVLDAGCGTGRVAIELHRRGIDVVGVDLDPAMLASARAKAPELEWIEADLATVELLDGQGLTRRFDVVAMPGNVMIFVAPNSEAAVVANLSRHLADGGLLVAGFQLNPGGLSLDEYDRHCRAAGLALEARWSTWDRAPFIAGGAYAVSVHGSGG